MALRGDVKGLDYAIRNDMSLYADEASELGMTPEQFIVNNILLCFFCSSSNTTSNQFFRVYRFISIRYRPVLAEKMHETLILDFHLKVKVRI